jgi:hypothetical protein
VSQQELFDEEFHAQTNVASALVLSGLAFGVWVLGAWMSNLHSSAHIIGAWVAIAGALVTVFCGWIAARAWSVQHQQRGAHIRATPRGHCRHHPSGDWTVSAVHHGEVAGSTRRQGSSAR